MALYDSRGYETDSSKVFMRLSVLLVDLLLFVPGVWAFCRRFYRERSVAAQLLAFVMICMQPVRPKNALLMLFNQTTYLNENDFVSWQS